MVDGLISPAQQSFLGADLAGAQSRFGAGPLLRRGARGYLRGCDQSSAQHTRRMAHLAYRRTRYMEPEGGGTPAGLGRLRDPTYPV